MATINVNDGDVVVRFDDGGSIEVRDWFAGEAFTGDMQDGELRTFDDGCTATRRGGKVVWTEPVGTNRVALAA